MIHSCHQKKGEVAGTEEERDFEERIEFWSRALEKSFRARFHEPLAVCLRLRTLKDARFVAVVGAAVTGSVLGAHQLHQRLAEVYGADGGSDDTERDAPKTNEAALGAATALWSAEPEPEAEPREAAAADPDQDQDQDEDAKGWKALMAAFVQIDAGTSAEFFDDGGSSGGGIDYDFGDSDFGESDFGGSDFGGGGGGG